MQSLNISWKKDLLNTLESLIKDVMNIYVKLRDLLSFLQVLEIGDVFDYQNCHLCSQRDPNEMCTFYLMHNTSEVVSFVANAAIMIFKPRNSRDEGIEISWDTEADADNNTHDVTEFNVSVQGASMQESAKVPAVTNGEPNADAQLFLHRAAGCITEEDNLWEIGLMLGAVHKEINQIRTDNIRNIKHSAFKMLMFCCEKKKCTWEEFRSKLQIAFLSVNLANEFEKLKM